MNTLEVICNWFSSQCDGDWEHEYGIKIETVDNPGWVITIDITYTSLASRSESERQDISNTIGTIIL